MNCLTRDRTNLGENENVNGGKVTDAESFISCPATNTEEKPISKFPWEVMTFTFKSWKALSSEMNFI